MTKWEKDVSSVYLWETVGKSAKGPAAGDTADIQAGGDEEQRGASVLIPASTTQLWNGAHRAAKR